MEKSEVTSMQLNASDYIVGVAVLHADEGAKALQLPSGIRIHRDGHVEIPAGLELTDAAREFWAAIEAMGFELVSRNAG